jgi:hypothetical protein
VSAACVFSSCAWQSLHRVSAGESVCRLGACRCVTAVPLCLHGSAAHVLGCAPIRRCAQGRRLAGWCEAAQMWLLYVLLYLVCMCVCVCMCTCDLLHTPITIPASGFCWSMLRMPAAAQAPSALAAPLGSGARRSHNDTTHSRIHRQCIMSRLMVLVLQNKRHAVPCMAVLRGRCAGRART